MSAPTPPPPARPAPPRPPTRSAPPRPVAQPAPPRTTTVKRDLPDGARRTDRLVDGKLVRSTEVLFGQRHTAGSPRSTADKWNGGEIDIVLCEYTTPFFAATAPLWPDEVAAGTLIYPHRFGITPLGHGHVSASPAGPLGPDATEALRRAGTLNRGVYTVMDLAPLLDVLGVDVVAGTQLPDLSRTAGRDLDITPSTTPSTTRTSTAANSTSGPRYATEPDYRQAVERRAVVLAIEHMEANGWPEVTLLGKPYDLVCRSGDGREKYVEVKGTSGAGGDVFYTPNEVHHFRTCPHGADLIVVRDITVDTTTRPYTTSGGQLLHIRDYTAPPEDLQATQWSGRVAGWDALNP